MKVAIIGGSGFLGQILKHYMDKRKYKLVSLDIYDGYLYDLLKSTDLGIPPNSYAKRILGSSKFVRRSLMRIAKKSRLIVAKPFNILDIQNVIEWKLRGYDAVVHLAAIPHPGFLGANADDFYRVNYLGSINVYQAARSAGVKKFIFASSGQVYNINKLVSVDSLPIKETNYCPTIEEGQSPYGYYKWFFEQYLSDRDGEDNDMQRVSLRLEMPGMRSRSAHNLYISTSLQNTAAMFERALDSNLGHHEVFNVADKYIPLEIADIKRFAADKFPGVPYESNENLCLMDTTKAESLIGYKPASQGNYLDPKRVFS